MKVNTRNDAVRRFKSFLIHKNVYVGFCDGLRERLNVTFVQRMNDGTSMVDIINSSLAWAETDEGRNFWACLHEEWGKTFSRPNDTLGCRSIW